MLQSYIEFFVQSLGPKVLTEVFIWILLGLFLFGTYAKRQYKHHAFTSYLPTLLTTFGILGTFAGIVSGLLGFSVENIDGSIEDLLSGLKTAFTTSLVGMVLSVIFKALTTLGLLEAKSSEQLDEDQLGAVEFYELMQKQTNQTEALNRSIGGDEDGSLVSQIKLMRSDANDQQRIVNEYLLKLAAGVDTLNTSVDKNHTEFSVFQEKLWVSLQDFADMLSKSATETVINALKDVISDFNRNLTEQFGENFKQLNAAVLELVQWQENYRIQLNQMIMQYEHGVTAIEKTEASVQHISEESSAIPKSMEFLKEVLEVNQHQLSELERHLSAFSDVRDRAVEAVPEIKAQIDQTVEGMRTATETLTEGVKKSTEYLNQGIQDSADVLIKGLTDSGEEMVQNTHRVNEALQSTSDVVVKNNEESKSLFDDFISDTSGQLRNLYAQINDDTKDISKNFKDASSAFLNDIDNMKDGFSASLEQMNSSLQSNITSILSQQQKESERIMKGVSDYASQALNDTGESVEKQIKALDQALERELNSVMTQFGKALTTITGKFTADYQKLVGEMQKITQSHQR